PFVPAPSTPAITPSATIEIDFVIVTAPKLPGSRTLISPAAAVFEMAPANVLHGAVREQGFTSSPTPETQVRAGCASATFTVVSKDSTNARIARERRVTFIQRLLSRQSISVTVPNPSRHRR